VREERRACGTPPAGLAVAVDRHRWVGAEAGIDPEPNDRALCNARYESATSTGLTMPGSCGDRRWGRLLTANW
jgi:hypothetical protein